MSEDVGQYALLLNVQSFLGTMTAGLQSCNKTRWKTILNIFFLCLNVMEASLAVVSFILYRHVRHVAFMSTLLGHSVILCVLIKAGVDHRPKISLVLNLQAAVELLQSVDVGVSLKSTFILAYILQFTYLCLEELYSLVFLLRMPNRDFYAALGVTKYITSFNFPAATLLEMLLYLLITFQITSMKREIKKEMYKTVSEFECEPLSSGLRRRRSRLSQRKWAKLKTLEEVLASISFEEHRTHDYFWPFLMLHCVYFCFIVSSNNYGLLVDPNDELPFLIVFLLSHMIVVTFYFLAIVALKGVSKKHDLGLILGFARFSSRFRGRNAGRHVKIQILGRIHRRPPTMCGVLRMDYSLPWTIVDTVVLIFTTMFSK